MSLADSLDRLRRPLRRKEMAEAACTASKAWAWLMKIRLANPALFEDTRPPDFDTNKLRALSRRLGGS